MKKIIEKESFSLRYKLAAIAITLLIFAALIFILFMQKQKPDPASEKILRRAAAVQLKEQTNIDKDPNELNDEDFSLIRRFDFVKQNDSQSPLKMSKISKEISDINPLEKFTNLKALHFQYVNYPKNKIPKWMNFLARFGIINLDKRCTIDLSPIVGLTNLKELEINGSVFNNFEPLSNLVNLKILTFENSSIDNLKPIKGLTKLEKLYIYDCKVTDLEPIKGLTNLKDLYIHSKEISDIGPLSQIANLRKLELVGLQINDLEPLKQLKNIEELIISNCPVTNIEAVKEFSNLKILLLLDTLVSNIEPIKHLFNLNNLVIIRCNNITDEQVEDLQKALPDLEITR